MKYLLLIMAALFAVSCGNEVNIGYNSTPLTGDSLVIIDRKNLTPEQDSVLMEAVRKLNEEREEDRETMIPYGRNTNYEKGDGPKKPTGGYPITYGYHSLGRHSPIGRPAGRSVYQLTPLDTIYCPIKESHACSYTTRAVIRHR